MHKHKKPCFTRFNAKKVRFQWKFNYNNFAKPTLEERKNRLENSKCCKQTSGRTPPDYALHKLLPSVSLPICQWLRSLISARVKDFRKCYPM